MIRKLFIYTVLLISGTITFIASCTKDDLYDIVLGPQPVFIGDNTFLPGLNIFGIIRPDSIASQPMTYVHVEKTRPAISNKPDSFRVTDAQVILYKIENNIEIDSIILTYSNPGSVFIREEYRPGKFNPQAGEHYKIVCRKTGLPELTGETVVPAVPQLEGNMVNIKGNIVQFDITGDTSATMYDVYLVADSNTYMQRIIREKNGNSHINIIVNKVPKAGARLTIFAYDRNLSEYFNEANVFIKPNTYRPPFSNVQNGYGCFGSLNLMVKDF